MKVLIAFAFLSVVCAIPRPDFQPQNVSSTEGLELSVPTLAPEENNQTLTKNVTALENLLSHLFGNEESEDDDDEDDDSDKNINLDNLIHFFNVIKDALKSKIANNSLVMEYGKSENETHFPFEFPGDEENITEIIIDSPQEDEDNGSGKHHLDNSTALPQNGTNPIHHRHNNTIGHREHGFENRTVHPQNGTNSTHHRHNKTAGHRGHIFQHGTAPSENGTNSTVHRPAKPTEHSGHSLDNATGPPHIGKEFNESLEEEDNDELPIEQVRNLNIYNTLQAITFAHP